MKVYTYKKCGTCQKAIKWLNENEIEYQEIAIREKPPTKKELKAMLESYDGELKKLFNTSGQDYRSLGLKDKIGSMTEKESIDLLSSNGNLVKRPFVITSSQNTVGFNADRWSELFE